MDKVTPDRILIVKVREFIDYNPKTGALTEKRLTLEEQYRMCIFMDGDLIDFSTGEVLSHIDQDKDGLIESEIRINTRYVEEVFKNPDLTDDEYNYAQELYEYYLCRKKLIQDGKLIPFKQKRLY